MRKKMIELIQQIVIPYWAELIADHLIANDVTIPVHGHWKLFGITGNASNVPYIKYSYAECSVCRDVESSVLYSRRFCPNCGAMIDRWE